MINKAVREGHMMPRVLAAIAIFAALIGYRVARADDQPAPPQGANTNFVEIGQDQAIRTALENAKKLGYVARVSPGASGGPVNVKLVKVGKTEDGHGLLGLKWDQRETITLNYFPTVSGLKLTTATHTVEQKAPVGQWQKVTENQDVPAIFVVPGENFK